MKKEDGCHKNKKNRTTNKKWPKSPKNEKFVRFSRKLVHVFQGKKKAGFKKEIKLDL